MPGFGMDDRLILTGALLVVAAIVVPNVLRHVDWPNGQKAALVVALVIAAPALVYGISWWRRRGE